MSDLFGEPEPRSSVKRPAAAQPAVPQPARGPVFGSRGWTYCICGRFAALHFPNAGGIRRCLRCATAEGRMKGHDA